MIRRALAAAAALTLLPLPAAAGPVDDIHALTNAERAKHGLPALERSDCLDNAAQQWTSRMAADNRTYHSGSRDYLPHVDTCNLRGGAENVIGVTGGTLTPQQAVTGWMNSPGHRANILNSKYRTIGVGRSGTYTTQHFGA